MSIGLLDSPERVLMEEPENPTMRAFRLNACKKEPWTAAWIAKMKPGWCLWDIGANVGSYSLLAAARGLRVVAIEPGAENHAMLCRNIALNRFGNAITPLPIALGQQTGLTSITYSSAEAGAALHRLGLAPDQMHHHILQLSMDELAAVFQLPMPHYVKLDTDGGELNVLLGGRQVLAHPQVQQVLIEVPRDQEQVITAAAGAAGLTLSQRWNDRDGQPMDGMFYGLWTRGD